MKKIVSIFMAITMLFSTIGLSVYAEGPISESEHIHAECCESDEIALSALGGSTGDVVSPNATCTLGHWFKTTEYRTGGVCYAKVDPSRKCQIIVYEVVTCNHCGKQLSHTEYSRRDGCIFLENH